MVGEVRGGEAADLLQALNTGHGGSLTTVHANNAESALSRIASCAMQGGGELPWEVTCRGVVDGIAMVIHMTRREGRRVVEEALFVKGYDAKENQWDIQPVCAMAFLAKLEDRQSEVPRELPSRGWSKKLCVKEDDVTDETQSMSDDR